MDRGIRPDIPLLVRVPKERPMVHSRLDTDCAVIPIWVPGIDMGVEVDDRDGPIHLGEGVKYG